MNQQLLFPIFLNNFLAISIMGASNQFCSTTSQPQQIDPFSFIFNSDPKEDDIYHSQPLMSKDVQLQKILKIYQEKLKQSRSLYIQPNSRSNSIILKSKEKQYKCKYLRPYQFLRNQEKTKPYSLMGKQKFTYANIVVREDSIMQFFGCFLCFLAENTHLLGDIIITQQNSYGLQVIKIKNYDRKEFLIVDDQIVCQGARPLFVQPIYDKYMWPCIIEKAWLKVKGSRTRKIFKSSPQQSIELFFNFPLQKIIFENEQEQIIIEKLQKYLYSTNYKRVIFTSKANPRHKIGLSNQHLFYIGSFNYQDRRLFYIKNPCINESFRGTHSIVSQQVKKQLKRELKITQIQKGCLIIDQAQLIQQMAYATIVHNQVGQQQLISKIQLLLEQEKYVKFQLKQKRNFSLGLEQKSQFDHLQCQNHYYPISYQLINCTQNIVFGGIQNSQACFGKKRTYFLQDVVQQLPKGTYILRLKTKPKTKNHVNINFYIFTNDKIAAALSFGDSIQNELKQEFEFSLKKICKKKLISNLNTEKSIPTSIQKNFQHVIAWLGDIVLVYIQKAENNKPKVNVQINFPQLVNLQCISSKLQKGQYKNFELDNNLLLIFEKIILTAETQIKKYFIEEY